jgi:hypothetical protein
VPLVFSGWVVVSCFSEVAGCGGISSVPLVLAVSLGCRPVLFRGSWPQRHCLGAIGF